MQAVDSLSFLETNIDLFLGFVRSGKHPAHEVRKKFNRCSDGFKSPGSRPGAAAH